MFLLSAHDRQTIGRRLDAVATPVTLLVFTQASNPPETMRLARQVVDEVAALNPNVTVDEIAVEREQERAAQYGITHVPAIVVLRDGADARMRFVGAPAGHELLSLVEAIVLAGSGDSGLSDASRRAVAEHIRMPRHVKVFVTPTCRYCPHMVTLANRLATESPLVTATCVDASEFFDLAGRYRVTGVPKTVVEGTSIELLGAVSESEFIAALISGGAAGDDWPAESGERR